MRKSATPRWDESESNRVRVLLECPPAESPSIIASAIERPRVRRTNLRWSLGEALCVVGPRSLRPVDGADVVVNMLGIDPTEIPVLPRSGRTPALPGHGRRGPDRARVEPRGQDVTAVPDLADAAVEVAGPMTTSALFKGIEAALQRREQRIAWWGDGFC